MHCDGRPVLNPSRDYLRISGPIVGSAGESTITKVSRPAREVCTWSARNLVLEFGLETFGGFSLGHQMRLNILWLF
jgi:hypothetical protein